MLVYRRILLQTCFVDLFYTFGVIIVEPIFAFKNGNEVVVNNGMFRNISHEVDFYLLGIYLYGVIFTYCAMPVQFIYRYYVLVKSKNFSKLAYAALFIVPLCVNTYHIVLNGFFFYPDPLSIKVANEDFGEYFLEEGMNHTAAGWIGQHNRIEVWLVAVDMFIITWGGYAIIVWCNFKIWKHLKNNMVHASDTTKEMNSMLNKTLIAQALGPLAVNVIPMLIFVYCIVTKEENAMLSIILGLPLAWIPVVNPFLRIWFVKPYRNAVLQIKAKLTNKSRTAPTSVQNHTNQLKLEV